jgi:hypothetical protein
VRVTGQKSRCQTRLSRLRCCHRCSQVLPNSGHFGQDTLGSGPCGTADRPLNCIAVRGREIAVASAQADEMADRLEASRRPQQEVDDPRIVGQLTSSTTPVPAPESPTSKRARVATRARQILGPRRRRRRTRWPSTWHTAVRQ